MRISFFFILILPLAFISCQQKTSAISKSGDMKTGSEEAASTSAYTKIIKTDEEWKAELNDMEFKVLRKAGTERAFTGDLLNNKEEGVYTCRGCQLPLFDSNSKFKSGTGWPSYFEPIKAENVEFDIDYKIGYKRQEVHCARCDGHLGHVFEDGPKPTGLRYCINAVSLDFEKREQP